MTKCKLGLCPRRADKCCMECELLTDCKDSDYACDAECEEKKKDGAGKQPVNQK